MARWGLGSCKNSVANLEHCYGPGNCSWKFYMPLFSRMDSYRISPGIRSSGSCLHAPGCWRAFRLPDQLLAEGEGWGEEMERGMGRVWVWRNC